MDCVVTGGAGFIGSNLVDALIARGDRVTVIDNLSTGKRSNLERALASAAPTLHEADVRDAERGGRDLRRRVGPRWCSTWPPRSTCATRSRTRPTTPRSNVLGTIAVLEAARAAGARRVVNTSTGGGLYGDAELLPDARGPPDPAAGALRAGQARRRGLLRAVHPAARAVDGLAALRQRLRARARTSTARPAWSRSSAGALIEGATPTVFGDGRQTRDWVEVGDVVRGQPARRRHATSTGPVNIGHGQETSVLDLLEALNDVGGGRPLPEPSSPPSARARSAAAAST